MYCKKLLLLPSLLKMCRAFTSSSQITTSPVTDSISASDQVCPGYIPSPMISLLFSVLPVIIHLTLMQFNYYQYKNRTKQRSFEAIFGLCGLVSYSLSKILYLSPKLWLLYVPVTFVSICSMLFNISSIVLSCILKSENFILSNDEEDLDILKFASLEIVLIAMFLYLFSNVDAVKAHDILLFWLVTANLFAMFMEISRKYLKKTYCNLRARFFKWKISSSEIHLDEFSG